jgi:hypothetical protein
LPFSHSKNHNNKTKQKMKNLNESIGLGGGNGMSHFEGVAIFDVNADPEVIRIVKLIADKNTKLASEQQSLDGALARSSDYPARIEYHRLHAGSNTALFNQAVANENVGNEADLGIIRSKTPIVNGLKKDLSELAIQLNDAKKTAISANNDSIDAAIKKIQADALTNPDALKNMTELNRQKQEGEQALAKQKIEADSAKNKSSNIKIYVIVGAVLLTLAAIAGLWIWLKSRKAV